MKNEWYTNQGRVRNGLSIRKSSLKIYLNSITFETSLDFRAPPSASFEAMKMSFLDLTDAQKQVSQSFNKGMELRIKVKDYKNSGSPNKKVILFMI